MKKRSKNPTRSRTDQLALARALVAMRDRVKWLLDFASRDLSSVTEEEIDAIRWPLLTFIYWPNGELEESASELRAVVPAIYEQEQPSRRSPLHGPSPESEVRRIQNLLREGMAALFRGRAFLSGKKVHPGVRRNRDGSIVPVTLESEEARLFGSIFQILMGLGPRLRVCNAPGCGRFFAANRRGQQLYCRSACAQRVRSARFYAAHHDDVRAHSRARYEGRVRRQLGSRVRIQRHPRKSPASRTR